MRICPICIFRGVFMKKRVVLVIVALILVLAEVAFVIYQKTDIVQKLTGSDAAEIHETGGDAESQETAGDAEAPEQTAGEGQTEGAEEENTMPTEFLADNWIESTQPPKDNSADGQQSAGQDNQNTQETEPEETQSGDELDENELPRIPF